MRRFQANQLAAFCFALILAGAADDVRGTVLTYSVTPALGNGSAMPQDYGDHVSSTSQVGGSGTYGYLEGNGFTPNVTVGYSAQDGGVPLAPPNGYNIWQDGEWTGVGYLRGVGTVAPVYDTRFTPASPTTGVKVNSFVIDDYDGFAGAHTINWWVYKDFVAPGNVLASAAGVAIPADAEVPINTGIGSAHAGEVILRIQHVAGAGNDLGIDDVNFDQAAVAAPPNKVALIGTADGTLHRYDDSSQSVSTQSSGWGGFDQMVALDDGRALFGATATGGTLAVATADAANSVATGLGTFQQMTAINSGGAGHAVYGSTAADGTVGGFDGTSHSGGTTGLTAGGGSFSALGDLGDGNALIGTAGGSLNGALRKVDATGAVVQTGDDGWGAITHVAGLPGNDQAFFGTTFNDGVYFWNDSPSYVGGGVTGGWQGVQQLIAVNSSQFLLGAGFGSGTATVRNSSNAATVTEGGWIDFQTAVSLTNGDALAGTGFANGSVMLYDADAGDGDTYVIDGNNWGTFEQMIAMDNGFGLWGSSGISNIDGQWLGLWDGASVSFSDNGGLGWGNFELMFDLGMGKALVGTDAAGGTLYLVRTATGGFDVTTIQTGLGSFQVGAAVAAPVAAVVPEPSTLLLLAVGLAGFAAIRRRPAP